MTDLLEKVAPKVVLGAADLRRMLRARFPAEEYALLFEVPNGTGAQSNRYADAIAVSLWPSRGLTIMGFEIKVSRSDWTRELANPKKAEDIARFCDHWSLVVSDEKIVHPGELPAAWGLIVARGDKLKCLKEPAKLEPAPLTRVFVAAMCRAAQKASPAKLEIDAAVAAAVKIERANQEAVYKQNRESNRFNYERLRGEVNEFEAASGVRIIGWQAGDIGKAVKTVLNGGLNEQAKTIRDALRQIGGVHDGLRALEALLPKEDF